MTSIHINQLKNEVKGDKLIDENGYIINDERDLINVKIPNIYSSLPPTDLIVPHGHHLMMIDDIKKHQIGLFNNDRIKIINGVNTSIEYHNDYDKYYCTSCSHHLENLCYYYCYDCQYDLCDYCKVQNNVAEKIDHTSHHLVNRKINNLHFCDSLCVDDMDSMDKPIISSKKYSNGIYNMCLKCSETSIGMTTIHENQLKLIDNHMPNNYCDFGSLMDWIPIIRDSEHDLVLINFNPESEYHGKFALCSVDDHGRGGYYTLWEKTSIQKIIDEIQSILIESNSKQSQSTGWDAFYELPIKTMMERRNMQIHYG